jgi:hypothetical protein
MTHLQCMRDANRRHIHAGQIQSLRHEGGRILADRVSRPTPTPNPHYLGPMLRADYWEATATTELRNHAADLAGHLLHESPP